jgi:hypothetical protein
LIQKSSTSQVIDISAFLQVKFKVDVSIGELLESMGYPCVQGRPIDTVEGKKKRCTPQEEKVSAEDWILGWL